MVQWSYSLTPIPQKSFALLLLSCWLGLIQAAQLWPFLPADVQTAGPVHVWSLSKACPKDAVCLRETYRPSSFFPGHQEEALFFPFRLVHYQGTFFSN